jgi:DNA-binding FadR family transcriptional regulator
VPKAAELVADHIRSRIVRGQLAEGDALPPESELMAQFGVSRPTLREGLRVLESQALISVHRGARGGARVRVPDVDVAANYAGLLLQVNDTTIDDVLRTKWILETAAVGLLAERPLRSRLAGLRAVLEEEEQALDDLHAFSRAAHAFHVELIRATESNTLTLLASMLDNITDRHATAVTNMQDPHPGTRPMWRTKTHAVHTRLVDLIERQESSEALELWRKHVRDTHRALLTSVDATTVLDLFE